MRHPEFSPSAGNVHLTSREVGSPAATDWLPAANFGGTSTDASDRLRAAVAPAIVKIKTDKSVGSGFFVDENGMVATVAHNVLGSKHILVETSDHKLHEAKIAKMNDVTDVAELKVEMNGAKSKFLRLGNSASLQAGQSVNAFGFAFAEVDQAAGKFQRSEIPLAYVNRDRVEHSTSPDASDLKDYIDALYTPILATTVHRDPGDSGGVLVDQNGSALGLAESQEPGVLGSSHFRKIEDFKDLASAKTDKFAFDYVPDCPVGPMHFGFTPSVPICKPPLSNHPPELYRMRRTNGESRPPFDWLKIFPPA